MHLAATLRLVDAWSRAQRLVLSPKDVGASDDEFERHTFLLQLQRERPGVVFYFVGDCLVCSTDRIENGWLEQIVAPPADTQMTVYGDKDTVVASQVRHESHERTCDGWYEQGDFRYREHMVVRLPDPAELRARDSATAKAQRSQSAYAWVRANRAQICARVREKFNQSLVPEFSISPWTVLTWMSTPTMYGDEAEVHTAALIYEYVNDDHRWSANISYGCLGPNVHIKPRGEFRHKRVMDLAREVD